MRNDLRSLFSDRALSIFLSFIYSDTLFVTRYFRFTKQTKLLYNQYKKSSGVYMGIAYKKLTEKELDTFIEMRIDQLRE